MLTPGPTSSVARRATAWVALGVPRSCQEWPPGPSTVTVARVLPTWSATTSSRPWPSSASAASGSSSPQAWSAPRRLPSPSSPTVNATASPAGTAAIASSTQTADRTPAALSPTPGPTSSSPSRRMSSGVSAANTVSMCASTSSRGRSRAESPDQVADLVGVALARQRREPPLEPLAAGSLRAGRGGDRGERRQLVGADHAPVGMRSRGMTAVTSISICHSGRAKPLTTSPVEQG